LPIRSAAQIAAKPTTDCITSSTASPPRAHDQAESGRPHQQRSVLAHNAKIRRGSAVLHLLRRWFWQLRLLRPATFARPGIARSFNFAAEDRDGRWSNTVWCLGACGERECDQSCPAIAAHGGPLSVGIKPIW
jgi:hypothetical protein